jgi:aryl sulfotransferase
MIMTQAARPERKYVYNNMMTDSRRWDAYVPRDGDIIISTPPKCGTTWTQMICALLIFQKFPLDRKLSEYTLWLDMPLRPLGEILDIYDAQTHRRFIKTHTPLDGVPYFDNVTYLFVARDPRDAFFSMGNHRKNTKPEMLEIMLRSAKERSLQMQMPASDVRAAFRNWISASGIPDEGGMAEFNVLHHARTFWEFRHLPNIIMMHYSDMKADLEGQMRRLAAALNISVEEGLWPQLADAASFERMKENADTLAPSGAHPDQWRDKAAFFNKGEHGQWQGVLGEEELALYRQIMKERLEPDLARWLEHGWKG